MSFIEEAAKNIRKTLSSEKKTEHSDYLMRQQMWALKTFSPLVVASIFNEAALNLFSPLFTIPTDKPQKATSLEDKMITLRDLMDVTERCVQHASNDLNSLGYNVFNPENRWVLRVLMTDCARLVATAKLTHGRVDEQLIKQALSVSAVLLHGKPVPGLIESEISQSIISWRQQHDISFLGEKENYNVNNNDIALTLAFNSAITKLQSLTKRFDFFQSTINDTAKNAVFVRLSDVLQKQSRFLYDTSLNIFDDAEVDLASKGDASEHSRTQLMMRCISDTYSLLERIYEDQALIAVREIRNAPDATLRNEIKERIRNDGVPFEIITHELEQNILFLSAASKSGVNYLRKAILQENKAERSPQSTPYQSRGYTP